MANGGQAGIGVPQNQHGVRLNGRHQLVGAVDDVAHGGAQVVPHCVHIHIRVGKSQVPEENPVQVIIVILPRVGENAVKIFAALVDDRRQTDDLRAGAYDDEQSIGIEEVDVLIGKQDEEGRPHGDGGHEVGKEGHGVHIAGRLTSPVLGHGVADEGADGARQQGTGHADQQGALECVPDSVVVEDAFLSVHAVFGDVLIGDPPLGGQVVRVPGV